MDESYQTEIAKMAVARACVALGFKNCQTSALESMADILKHYIETLAKCAHQQAEVGGRVYVGIQDVIPALESTRPKNTSWKQLRSFALEDSKYTSSDGNAVKWNQPFPFEVPKFPAPVPAKADLNPPLDKTCTRDSWVPKHLPNYPPAHTYKKSAPTKKRPISQISVKPENSSSTSAGGGPDKSEHGVSSTGSDMKSKKRVASIKSAQESLSLIEDSADR